MKTSNKMTRAQAIKMDHEFYADHDEETNSYCVFGVSSGFAYASFSDRDEAEGKARSMTREA